MCPTQIELTPDPDTGPVGVAVIVYVVARRVELPASRVLYYDGPISGWVSVLADAESWADPASAALVAANFPGAVVVRVMLWDVFPAIACPDDLP